MNNNAENTKSFANIQEIRQRKLEVLEEIRKDNKEINVLWKSLFKKNETKKKGITISTIMNTGMGVLDGFLLVWKLYHKFNLKRFR